VVRLDGRRRALEADRLDDVRVQGALEEPLDLAALGARLLDVALELGRLLLEHLDERVADDLALGLGVLDALELAEEELGRVDDRQVDAEVLAEHLVDLLGLVQAQDAVVDHDGVETARREERQLEHSALERTRRDAPVTDGLVHELGGDGRVDAARDGADDLPGRTDEFPDALDLLVDEFLLQDVDSVSVCSRRGCSRRERELDAPWSSRERSRRC